MATSALPEMAAANIPSITTLRNELDYGEPRLPRCAAFYNDTRAFRKKFVTSCGVAGFDLHDWRSHQDRAGLTEMTAAYLDKEGNGPLFWPDDESSPKYNRYQYSKDHARIKRLLKQLFFRLNQQQFRNKKYKHKEKSTDNRGSSEQNAIDVDAPEESQIITTALGRTPPAAPALADETSPTAATATGEPSSLHQGSAGQRVRPDGVIPDNADIYAVPPSLPRMRQFDTMCRPARAKRGPPGVGASVTPGRQSKRLRQRHSIKDGSPSLSNSTGPQRISLRTRRAAKREGYHGLDVMNEVIDSADASDPGLGSPNPSPQPSLPGSPGSPGSPAITVRGPVKDGTGDRTRPPAHSERPNSSATLDHVPSPLQSPVNFDIPMVWPEEIEHRDNQARFEPIHSASSPSNQATHPEFRDRDTDQPNPPLSWHPDASPTPGPRAVTSTAATAAPHTPQNQAAVPTKIPINFNYRVVLSRTPRAITERWTPAGRFQDKTLAGLLKELPFAEAEASAGGEGGSECEGLIFTIESVCLRTVERILRDDEEGFASMKRYINLEMREWLGRQRRVGAGGEGEMPRLVVDVIIERMSDEKKREVGGVEDLELEW